MSNQSPENSKIVRVFISSPSDVEVERDRARQVVENLRRRYARKLVLKPVLWGDLPLESVTSFQGGIDLFLNNPGVDIGVFILWSRLGSPLGPNILKEDSSGYRSGTEREYDLMRRAREQSLSEEGIARPRMLVYTRRDETSFGARLSALSTPDKTKAVEQKALIENFLLETFQDKDTGTNIGAFHVFDHPVTFSQRLRTHLVAMLDELAGDMDEVIWDIESQGPPFVGLLAFQPKHAEIFFGREEEVLEARNALKHQACEGCAFLLLSGASGSGKSSLARAGIVPEIMANELNDQIDVWRKLIVTPTDLGTDLVSGLVTRLAGETLLPELRGQVASLGELAADLLKDPDLTFRHTIKKAIEAASIKQGGGVRFLLVLDQLEELFTREGLTKEARDAFLAVIETFARSGLIWVIATIRSDFYQEIQNTPAILRMKAGRGLLDVLPPGLDALQRVIEEPARRAGLTFETNATGQSLSSRILKDATPYTELLPLLEFVLTKLYENRTETRLLTFAAYESLGGVEGALAKAAEDTFTKLPLDAQQALGTVLQTLVTLGEDGEKGESEKAVRQSAPLSLFDGNEPARKLVDAFTEARLFTTGKALESDEPAVTLAHESLLRVWPRAVEWRTANADFLRVRARIASRMREGSPLLKGDALLETAKVYLETRKDSFTLDQCGWISQSVIEVQKKEAQSQRRRKIALTVISAFALLAICAAAVALFFGLTANSQRLVALKEARVAQETLRFVEDSFSAVRPEGRLTREPTVGELFESAVSTLNARQFQSPDVEVRLRCLFALILGRVGQQEDAFLQIEGAKKTLDQSKSNDRLELSARISLAEAMLMLKSSDGAEEAVKLLQSARDTFPTNHPFRSLFIHDCLYGQFSGLGMLRKWDAAIELCDFNIKEVEKLFGDKSAEMAKALRAKALLLEAVESRREEARQLLKQSIEILKNIGGPDHEELPHAYAKLSFSLIRDGQADEALQFSIEACRIARIQNKNNSFLLIQEQGLAESYVATGNYPKAIEQYSVVTQLAESVFGMSSPEYAESLSKSAKYKADNQSFEEAGKELQVAVEILAKDRKANAELLVHCIMLVASINRDVGRIGSAVELYEEARRLILQYYPLKREVDHIYTNSNLAMNLIKLNRSREALPLMEEVVAIIDENLEPDRFSNRTIALMLNNLGWALQANNRLQDAADAYKRAIDISEDKDLKLIELDQLSTGSSRVHPEFIARYNRIFVTIMMKQDVTTEVDAFFRRGQEVNEKSYSQDLKDFLEHAKQQFIALGVKI